jgi:hypothetical protein
MRFRQDGGKNDMLGCRSYILDVAVDIEDKRWNLHTALTLKFVYALLSTQLSRFSYASTIINSHKMISTSQRDAIDYS